MLGVSPDDGVGVHLHRAGQAAAFILMLIVLLVRPTGLIPQRRLPCLIGSNYRFIIDNGLFTTLITMSIFVAFNAGVTSLGSIGFMAIGGYTTAILTTKHGWPRMRGVIAGVVVGGVIAAVFGAGVLRLSGIYLALGTFALAQATIIFIQAVGFTNGVNGIAGIPRRSPPSPRSAA